MTRLDEQSNVPLVSTRNIVGTPAVAVMMRGEYPLFADTSIYCVPSIIVATPAVAADFEDAQ
jgi:hypothetical protein